MIPDVQGWACNLCVEREERVASMERELEKLRAKVAAGERDVRRTLKPLSVRVDKENLLESSFIWSIYLYTILLVCALLSRTFM